MLLAEGVFNGRSCWAKPQTPRNLTLNEGLVEQAKAYTSNLSATMEALLTDFVANQQMAQRARQQLADTCAADWNAVHAEVGSFADDHSTL